MSTARLNPVFPSKFNEWILRSGFTDEYDFWSTLSELSEGSLVDHMVHYLVSLGYGGTPNDMFRQFLKDQTGSIGSTFDDASVFFDGIFVIGGGGAEITDEGGFSITDEGGDPITDGT